MGESHSERPPSMRDTRWQPNGTLVTVEYDDRGSVVRETYYSSPDEGRLARIRERFTNARG